MMGGVQAAKLTPASPAALNRKKYRRFTVVSFVSAESRAQYRYGAWTPRDGAVSVADAI
jgi:hypothetical protein